MPKRARAEFSSTRVSWRDHEQFGAGRRDGWLRLTQDSDLATLGVELRVRFERSDDGQPIWTGLLLTAEPGFQLNTKLLRDLRLGAITSHAAWVAFLSDGQMRQVPQALRPKGRPRRKEDSDQFYWLGIASDYRKVRDAHPTRVMTELGALWNVDRTTAGRRVKRARLLQYLDPSE